MYHTFQDHKSILINTNNENVKIQIKQWLSICNKYNKDSYSEKGQYMKVKEEDKKKKEEMISQDKRDNVWVTQSPKICMYYKH